MQWDKTASGSEKSLGGGGVLSGQSIGFLHLSCSDSQILAKPAVHIFYMGNTKIALWRQV